MAPGEIKGKPLAMTVRLQLSTGNLGLWAFPSVIHPLFYPFIIQHTFTQYVNQVCSINQHLPRTRCNAWQFQIGGRETNGQVHEVNERTPQRGSQKGESNMVLRFLAWAARWTQILVIRIKKTRKGCSLRKAMRIKRLVWNEVSVRCLWHIQGRMSSRQLEIMKRFGLEI